MDKAMLALCHGKATMENPLKRLRNDRILDWWSLGHLALGILFGWWLGPVVGMGLLLVWEPVEILVLGPWLWRRWRIEFGYETWRNSLSDIVVDALGVGIGAFVL